MQGTEGFLELAAIAGVFVGFGALIAVRSGGPSDPLEVAPMRMMVSMGMLTIVAALAPVALGRYGITGHQVWALSGALVLAGWGVIVVVSARTPEYRAGWAAELEANRARRPGPLAIVGWASYVLYMAACLLTPILIVLGVAPDLEAALYFSLVVIILLGAGWILLGLAFAQRSPAATD